MVSINQETIDKLLDQFFLYLPKIAGAIIVLILGFIIIKIITMLAKSTMRKRKVDESLLLFLVSLLGISLKIMLIISVVSMIGVQMTSFIAVIGAAGLAVGLALQGSLANFAGGVLILLFKPFKVGDVIDAQGHTGKVNRIDIFNTVLKTPDNTTIILPNGSLSNGSIKNYTTEPKRRVDLVAGIGYDDDIDKAKKILKKIASSEDRVFKDPEPVLIVKELADSSVNIGLRVWVNNEDYWNIYFEFTEKIKKEFDKAKVSIPYPQRDVHLYKAK